MGCTSYSVIKFQGLEEKEIIKDSRYAVIANLSHNLAIHLESGTKELVLDTALILFLVRVSCAIFVCLPSAPCLWYIGISPGRAGWALSRENKE